MPNRYVRESAIESEGMNALSWQAEVFYRRLLNRADDFGRFSANAKILRASLFPLQLEKVRETDIAKLLVECEAQKLIQRYEVDGKAFLLIHKWEQGRAKTSRYPSPPDNICEHPQTSANICKHPLADAPDSDSDSDCDTDCDTDSDVGPNASASAPAVVVKAGSLSDAQWLESLAVDPTYQGIDVQTEHGKMCRWCDQNRKQPSRRRFVNWLNRCEKPMAGIAQSDQPQRRMSFA